MKLLKAISDCRSVSGKEETRTERIPRHAVARFASLVAIFVLSMFNGASAQTRVSFVNVADSTQGLSDFSQFPAINNRGAASFVATQNGGEQGVFKWERHSLKTIASTTDARFSFFTDDVVINSTGVVGFRALLPIGGRAAGIFTSDGSGIKTIVNSKDQGLAGQTIGEPSINDAGTVAFQASRNGLRSSVILTGDGGPLTTVLDTVNSNFIDFGAVAINSDGEIVFRGILKGRQEGVFVVRKALTSQVRNETAENGNVATAAASVIDIVDSINQNFFGFGDPVINNAHIVAAFTSVPVGVGTGVEVFSGDARGITARSDPNVSFAELEHPSLNKSGALAFSSLGNDGSQAIWVELTGGASPVAILQSGDALFGSRVTVVSVGRFAFNDHLHLAFQYELENGVTGIAVASIHNRDEANQDNSGDDEDREQ